MSKTSRWLMLIHQIPPSPAYLRVKVGRRLARIGAVALKSTVYVLPSGDTATEDFQWVRREIVEGGGDATIAEAHFVDGLTDGEVEALFRTARDEDYAAVVGDARALRKTMGRASGEGAAAFEPEVKRLERRLDEIGEIDFFGASGRESASALVVALRARLMPEPMPSRESSASAERPKGRTWVTRAGVHVDRIASAWLIRRFIDPEAQFKFVAPKGYVPEPRELRFDMFDAEYSHEEDRCTFETLCRAFAIDAPGISGVAEIVHDIDVKDGKFGHPETDGVAAFIAGLALQHREDEARLRHGFDFFDSILAFYARKRDSRRKP